MDHGPAIIDLPDLEATRRLGQRLAELLLPGAVIALVGSLGAGKTHLTRALVEALGGAGRAVVSPTFTLINEYEARLPVYHFDAYRLRGEGEFFDLGAHEYLESNGVCLIEWADRVSGCLPSEYLRITLSITGPTSRRALLEAFGPRYQEIVERCTRRPEAGG